MQEFILRAARVCEVADRLVASADIRLRGGDFEVFATQGVTRSTDGVNLAWRKGNSFRPNVSSVGAVMPVWESPTRRILRNFGI